MGELQLFIFRSEGRKLFRAFLRTIRSAPSHARVEILTQLRHEFKRKMDQTDLYAIKYNLSDGRMQLRMLTEMLAMQH
jgi:hypothetical protein